MEYTSIKLTKETAKKLAAYKVHHRESYEDVIKRIIGELNPVDKKAGDASSIMKNNKEGKNGNRKHKQRNGLPGSTGAGI